MVLNQKVWSIINKPCWTCRCYSNVGAARSILSMYLLSRWVAVIVLANQSINDHQLANSIDWIYAPVNTDDREKEGLVHSGEGDSYSLC